MGPDDRTTNFVSFREFNDERTQTRRAIAELETESRRSAEALRTEVGGGVKAMQSQVDALVKSQREEKERALTHRVTMIAAIVGAVILGAIESATTIAVVFGSHR